MFRIGKLDCHFIIVYNKLVWYIGPIGTCFYFQIGILLKIKHKNCLVFLNCSSFKKDSHSVHSKVRVFN